MPLQLATFIRRCASVRRISVFTAFAVLLLAASTASARSASHAGHAKHAQAQVEKKHGAGRHHHAEARQEVNDDPAPAVERHSFADVSLPSVGYISDEMPSHGQRYEIKMARQTGEKIDVVYRIGDVYNPEAINNLSLFLRDNHIDEVKNYDPRIFDLLHTMLKMVGRPDSEILILCGYRSQETNDALRASHTTNAAKHSQHIEGNAVDFRVPGVSAATLRDAALTVGMGGVGYYSQGQFVHIDSGDVRRWSFGHVRTVAVRSRRHIRR